MTLEDLPHAARDHTVASEIRRYEDRIGTQAFRSYCWHGRMHTKASGLVRSSADDRTIAQPSNDHGLAAQLRIVALLDRSVKRVHVGMDDFSHDLTPKYDSGSEKPNPCHADSSVSITLLLDLRSRRCVAAIVYPDASN